MSASDDPYEVLGVSPTAGTQELKSAWRQASRRHHPDVGGDRDAFERVQIAWRIVGDPGRRASYDRRHASSTSSGRTHTTAPPTSSSAAARAAHPTSGGGQRATSPQAAADWSAPAGARTPPTSSPTAGPQSAPGSGPAAGQTPGPAGFWTRPTMSVDAQRLSWLARVPATGRGVVVTPNVAWWVAWVSPLAAALASLAALVQLSAYSSHAGPSAYSTGAVVSGLVVLLACAGSWTRFGAASTAALIALALQGWLPPLLPGVEGAVAAMSIWAGVAVAGLLPPSMLLLEPRTMARVIPTATARDFNMFGSPAMPGRPCSLDPTLAARMGEDALITLTALPALRVFHAPRSGRGPGVSHVLVHGSRVAVVDTIAWLPGDYSLHPSGVVLRAGAQFPDGATAALSELRAWKKRLPRDAHVHAWVMVGSPTGHVSISQGHVLSSEVTLGTPQQVVESIGCWLTAEDDAVVDRRMLLPFAQALADPASTRGHARRPGWRSWWNELTR